MPVGLPVASSPLATTWRSDPAAVIVITLFFGAGPGTYFDFATLSFHVPMAGSLCADTARVDPMTSDSPPSNTTEVTTELLKRFIRNLRVAWPSWARPLVAGGRPAAAAELRKALRNGS